MFSLRQMSPVRNEIKKPTYAAAARPLLVDDDDDTSRNGRIHDARTKCLVRAEETTRAGRR